MKKIARIEIRKYRGIEALDVDVDAHGLIAEGGNARGKTTILRALRAALCAQDIGPDAIRHGHDRAEILVDLDDLTVRRVIGPKKSSVSISQGDKVIATKQAYLTELLGTAPLDPLDLYLAKPKERRAKILSVLPISVSLADLRKFAPDLPMDFDVSGHGLEVLESARKRYYDLRTEANRAAADAKEAVSAAKKAAANAPEDDGVNVPGCVLAVDEATRALESLRAQERDAAAANTRTATTREKITRLRADANTLVDGPRRSPDTGKEIARRVDAQKAVIARALAEVQRLEAELATMREQHTHQLNELSPLLAERKAFDDELARAASREAEATRLRDQASELESAIASVNSPPTAEEIAAGEKTLADARDVADKAKAVESGRLARAKAVDATTALLQADARADELDATVKRLSTEAPAALLSAAGAIPGLSLDGDEVMLDGKRLDALSGAEQLDLAIEIARRANAKTKILIVDGLERLEPEALDRFVSRATAGDYQLIATRVSKGDLVIEALASDDESNGAEDAAE